MGTTKKKRTATIQCSSALLVILSIIIQLLLVSCATNGQRKSNSAIPIPDDATWKKIAIVPMPKRIQVTGKEIPISTNQFQIVIGKNATDQAKIGVDWINDKINTLGGKRLPVVTQPTNGKQQLVIGTVADNPEIAKAVKDGSVNVGTGNPGKKGYEIRRSKNGSIIYLAGADPIGTLYACVTFAELLVKKGTQVAWRQANVRDWPDFQHFTLASRAGSYEIAELSWIARKLRKGKPGAKLKEQFLTLMQANYDRLLRHKVSMFHAVASIDKYWANSSPEARAIFKEAMDYGKARGIDALCYACALTAGPTIGKEELKGKCITAIYQNTGQKRGAFIRCWCHDDLRKEWARKVAKNAVKMGITDIAFHDTDGGGFTNPAMWESRCDECRKRWGNNYGAAIVNKFMIYYRALKKQNPDIRIHLTQYPYNLGILVEKGTYSEWGQLKLPPKAIKSLRKKTIAFWTYLHANLPMDVTLTIRENIPEALEKWREITPGRGTLSWYALMSHYWDSFFSEAPKWTKSYLKYPDKDIMFPQYAGCDFGLMRIIPLTEVEYCWNVNAPGATPWNRKQAHEQVEHCQPKGKIFSVILPHVVENYFGKESAPYVVKALSCNINLRQLMRTPRRLYHLLKTAESMNWQTKEAEMGVKALNKLWTKMDGGKNKLGMTNEAFRRIIILREAFHIAWWVAKIQEQYFLAREALNINNLSKATEAVKQGQAFVAEAKRDFSKLSACRPNDPVIKNRIFKIYYRIFLADNALLAPFENELKMVESNINDEKNEKKIKRNGLIAELAKRRTISAVKTKATITVDGKLSEKVWDGTGPSMPLLVYPKCTEIAKAYSQFHTLYDNKNIYIGFNAFKSQGTVTDQDTVEVFLQPPTMNGGYVHFIFKADGTVQEQQQKEISLANGLKRGIKDNLWKCKGFKFKTTRKGNQWTGEMKIPFASLNVQPDTANWTVSFCRVCKINDKPEYSSTMQPNADSFHDSRRFALLNWVRTPFQKPEVALNYFKTKVATYTYPDRIATQLEFGVDIKSPVPLTNVKLVAEAYGKNGKLQATKVISKIAYLFPDWKSQDLNVIIFAETIVKGGVRLRMISDQIKSERWYRINGWQGAIKNGEIFKKVDHSMDALNSSFYIDSFIELQNKNKVKLLNATAGTVEFKFYNKPLLPHDQLIDIPHCFIHYGPQREKHPNHYNNSPFTVVYDPKQQCILFSIKNSHYAGWTTKGRGLKPGWNHVACVWEQQTGKNNALRIYINGKQVSRHVSITHADRLHSKVKIETVFDYYIQVGSLNSGFMALGRPISELRISNIPRYTENFTHSTKPLTLDHHTTVLLPLTSNLNGMGMTKGKQSYKLNGKSGFPK